MDYKLIADNMWIFLLLALWEWIWKGIALWKAARNKQLAWYIAILLINSAGILSIVYIKFFQKNKRSVQEKEVSI